MRIMWLNAAAVKARGYAEFFAIFGRDILICKGSQCNILLVPSQKGSVLKFDILHLHYVLKLTGNSVFYIVGIFAVLLLTVTLDFLNARCFCDMARNCEIEIFFLSFTVNLQQKIVRF